MKPGLLYHFIRMLWAAFTLVVPINAQTQTANQAPTVRIKTALIQTRAVVTDKQGKLIENLAKEEFEILENGKPQTLEFFSVTRLIGESAGPPSSATASEASKGNPAPANTLVGPARFIVFLVDTPHLSISSLEQIKRTLGKFVVEQMTGQDTVCVLPSAGALGILSQFTQDRRMLQLAINKLTLWQTTARPTLLTPYLSARVAQGDKQAMALAYEILRAEEPFLRNQNVQSRALQGEHLGRANAVLANAANQRRATLETLKAITERMTDLPGQRLIFLLTDGFPLQGVGGGFSGGELQPFISRATRAGIVLYALDAKGLQPTMIEANHPGIIESRQSIPSPSIQQMLSYSARELENGMTALAADTGGEAFFNTNDLNSRLQKALDNNRTFYTLAYYANTEEEPKKLRKISIRLKNHPEYVVRTQKGYLPIELLQKEDEQSLPPKHRLARALSALLPLTALGVSVAADYFEREADAAQLLLRTYIEGHDLAYREAAQRFHFDLEIAIAILDANGELAHGFSDEVKGSLPAEQLAVTMRNGFRQMKRLALAPGLYQVRVGIMETSSGRIGTAVAWCEIPKLNREKLVTSKLLLALSGAEQDARMRHGTRFYQSGEALSYHLRVYPSKQSANPESDITLQTLVVQGDKTIFQSPWMPLAARLINRDKLGLEVSGDLKLNNLKAGLYELRVLVRDMHAEAPILQAITFGLEP
ncbi:MAG: VWA domain-containing protein [Acidobacteria bacterium]|nr:VWA domain-containing protein [Acidobacteriota bacterium]